MTLATDPIDWELDDDDDLVWPLRWVRGLPAVKQRIKIKLGTFRGEWFLDRSFGVPYLPNDVVTEADALLGSKFNRTRALSTFRVALLEVPDVTEILLLDVSFASSTRVMTVTWKARTVFGDTSGESTL